MSKAMKTNGNAALAIPDEIDLPQGAGLEEADHSAYAIPFLRLLQKGSPVADPDSDAYVEGTKAGMIYNTVSGEVLNPEKEDLQFIPVFYRRAFVEWKPRDLGGGGGGGFVQEYPVAEGEQLMRQTTLDDKNRDILPNGNQLNDTRYHYVILLAAGDMLPAVISMDRTQIKRSKRWCSSMNQEVQAKALKATFQLSYKVETESQSKDGNTWRIWDVKSPTLVAEQSQLNAAIEFYKAIKSGAVKEAIDTLEEEGAANPPVDRYKQEPSEPLPF